MDSKKAKIKNLNLLSSAGARIAFLPCSMLIYVLGFFLLFPRIGNGAAMLAVLPVVTAGLLFGFWGGILSGIANILLFYLMLNFFGVSELFELDLLTAVFSILAIGATVGIVHGLSDRLRVELSKREQSEKALGESEIRYRELVQNANSIILRMDLKGNVTFFNEFAQKYFGYREDEILGRNVIGTIVPQKQTEGINLNELFKNICKDPGRYESNENENILRNGERVWIAWTNKLIRDNKVKVSEILSIGNDITLHKQMEDRMRAVNAELSSINERMARDIIASAKIQQSVLPERSLVIPELNVEWIFQPSENVGGDIFNIFRLDEEHVGLYMLDVSGHGVTAALLSVTLSRILQPLPDTSTLLKKRMENPPGYDLAQPSQVAERLNKQFQLNFIVQQYFSLFYGILNLETLRLRYVSAGHPPLIYVPQNTEAQAVETYSFPIGFTEEPEYQENSISLRKGDRFYLYTDGIFEVLNSEDKEFGVERVVSSINQDRSLSLKNNLQALKEKIDNWCGDRKVYDDITILAVEIVDGAE